MKLRAGWSYPNAVYFGAGRIAELPAVVSGAGILRPLFVSDRRLIQTPVAQNALALLSAAGLRCEVFSDADANPDGENLAAGTRAFLEGECDGVVAFGGGSALDLGKLVAFMARQKRPVWDFEDAGDNWKRADSAAIYPSVAAPTTAGTGSEVGRAGVLTDSQKKVKKIIFHPKILPVAAVCDPELTAGMPPELTAGTGMDAFVHCMEAYCSPHYHPMSHGIALEGMRLVMENLPRAYADGGDLEARAHMSAAAAMGAVAFQKGLGAAHALSHAAGAVYNTPHGMTCAVAAPYALRFNRGAVAEKIARAAAYLGIGGGFDGFYEKLLSLREELGVPQKLRELGVGEDRIGCLAKLAAADPSAAGNPVELSVAAAESLFRECI